MRTLLSLLFALILAQGALAGSRHYVVGVEDQPYLPLCTLENGAYAGFARELLDAFARDRGYSFDYRPLPIPRLYASFLGGQVDFKFPDNPNWKKDQRAGKKIAYSDPVAAFIDGVSVRPDRLGAGPDKIATLGIPAGFTAWAWQDRIGAGRVRVVENPRFDALIRQVMLGRIDGVYANVAVINYQLDHVLGQPGALRFDPGLPYSRDQYHLSSLRAHGVVAEFNAWLKRNHDKVEALKAKHAVEKGVK